MKINWIRGVALALGIALIPNIASAQYTIGNPNAGQSVQSYGTRPIINNNQARGYVNPNGATPTMVSYPQGGAVGSGIANDHVHVPAQSSLLENPVLNSQYPSAGNQMPYEQIAAPTPVPQPIPQAQPQAMTYQPTPMGSSCPSCATGSCAIHGSVLSSGSIGYDCGDSCGTGACGISAPSITSPSPWIFGGGALLLNRIDNHNVKLATNPSYPDYPVLTTGDARMLTTGGFQVSGGRYFGCGQYALIASYWGIFSNPNSYTVYAPAVGSLKTDLPFTVRGPGGASVPYGIQQGANTVYDIYTGSQAQRITRDQQFNNVEINFFSFALGGGARQPYNSGCGSANACNPCGPSACGTGCGSGPTGPCAPWFGAQCSKLRLNLFAGIRWFQFKDSLNYDTSRTDNYYGTTNDDFYYHNGVTNNLVGFQIGSQATYCCGRRVNFYTSSSFGIYGNQINANTRAGYTDTAATILSTNSFNGRSYDYTSSKNDIAFLGEGTVGTGICICKGLTGNIGYRVIGVSGVATAVGQIPRDFSNGNDITRINNYDSLILHGLVLGVNYNF